MEQPAIDNTALFRQLLSQGKIAIQPAPCPDQSPPTLPPGLDFEHIEGMLLGLAIGDALGNTTESQNPSQRLAGYGEIRDYLPNQFANGQCLGVPSDDTQMSFWTLEQLIADNGLVPDHLAARFCQQPIFGIGHNVKDFIHAYKDLGTPWQEAGQPSAGNGALMRIAPVLVPHLRRPSPALWADTVLAGMVTHNDRASNACCAAFIHLLWQVLCLSQPPQPAWWLETFLAVERPLEGETAYIPRVHGSNYVGSLAEFTRLQVSRALERHIPVVKACNSWYSGAYLLETVPSLLYILCTCAHDPEEAILQAVNNTRDNDTVAAMVGAAVGALHGKKGLPPRWLAGLTGRLGVSDDGKVCALIDQAKKSFWEREKGD